MKIGFTCSAFDLLHAGHILMLEEAKSHCDYLIVGLQIDPSIDRPSKNKPIQSPEERLIQLSAVKYVDEIITYETEEDLLNILKVLRFDVRFLGEEYKNMRFTGDKVCEKRRIQIYYNKRKHKFSTSELRDRVKNAN